MMPWQLPGLSRALEVLRWLCRLDLRKCPRLMKKGSRLQVRYWLMHLDNSLTDCIQWNMQAAALALQLVPLPLGPPQLKLRFQQLQMYLQA
mmetsp:Transcript_13034/g.37896  ORF Transcript_13034/g.37896 Transcript_13034/m.37896 type:complete len:91 (-) Transcript_13034:507-779(-)